MRFWKLGTVVWSSWMLLVMVWFFVDGLGAATLFSNSAIRTGSPSLSIFSVSNYGQYQLDNGLARTPPMGWNGWNTFGCSIDENTVKETTDALISTGLAKIGYNYVNLDDCWAELQRTEQGSLHARNSTFPSGIKALADYIHSKGLKFGIYSDAGYNTCQKQPGSLGYEVQDANTFASWGADYLKYDNCFNDGSIPEVRYTIMRDALNQTGRAIFFSMCEWGVNNPAEWASNVANSWRTADDIVGSWESMVTIADTNNKWAAYAGPGGWNDPDMLDVGNGEMTLEESRSHFSVWSLMKAPLLIGCDVRNVSKQYIDILSNVEVISVNQDSLGVQGKKVSQQGSTGCLEVWAGPLSHRRITVLFWNRCNVTGSIRAHWNEVGLKPSTVVTVRDLWKHEDLSQMFSRTLEVQVQSHSSEMYVFTPTSRAREMFTEFKPHKY